MKTNMSKKWYTVQLSAKLDDSDIKALKRDLFKVLEEQLEISTCVALDIELEDDQDD